jgi:hypothetical protein
MSARPGINCPGVNCVNRSVDESVWGYHPTDSNVWLFSLKALIGLCLFCKYCASAFTRSPPRKFMVSSARSGCNVVAIKKEER